MENVLYFKYMDALEKYDYWHDIAEYDLKTAQSMNKTGLLNGY